MTTKKVMIVPCKVRSAVYPSGVIAPPVSGKSHSPTMGTLAKGHASWKRMSSAIRPPINSITRPRAKNWIPMTLWSVEKT